MDRKALARGLFFCLRHGSCLKLIYMLKFLIPLLLFSQTSLAAYESKIFFGLSNSKGEISEKAWQKFMDQHLSKAFTKGYTVLDAKGFWRGQKGLISEKSKVVLVIYEKKEAMQKKISRVIHQYIKDFDQEAVIMSTHDIDFQLLKPEK